MQSGSGHVPQEHLLHPLRMPTMLAISLDPTNLPLLDRFPDYVDPLETFRPSSPKMADSVKPKAVARLQSDTESSRGPSPQPTHVSVPLAHNYTNGHRILRSATVGYIAPEFQGKVEQMKAGKFHLTVHGPPAPAKLTYRSQGYHPTIGVDSRIPH